MNDVVSHRRSYLYMIPGIDAYIEEKMAKLLVVDDDKNLLLGISRILSKAGFDVITANDGFMGIQKAQNEQPDLILLDVNMPVMNGFQVKKILDNTPATQYIPTIFLTALSDRGHILDGLNMAEDYLTKPFDTRILRLRFLKNINTEEKPHFLC